MSNKIEHQAFFQQKENTVEVFNNDNIYILLSPLLGIGKANKHGLDLLLNLPNEDKDIIINLFKTKKFKLKQYFKKNGFPNNQTKNDFYKNFSINEYNINKNIVESKENAKKLYLSTYKEIKDIKSDSRVFNELLNRLAGLDKGTVNISEITKYLSNLDDNQFKELLNTFKKYDEENGTELYSSFRDTLISLDSSFKSKINVFENKLDLSATSIVDLQGARMKAVADSSLLGKDLYKGGVDANLDITKRPPERFLKNKEGYKLETPLGVRDFYEATVTYEKGKQKLDTEKIIYGEIGSKNSIFAGLNPSIGFTINNQNMLSELDKYGIRSNGGWNINVIRKNLKKSNN